MQSIILFGVFNNKSRLCISRNCGNFSPPFICSKNASFGTVNNASNFAIKSFLENSQNFHGQKQSFDLKFRTETGRENTTMSFKMCNMKANIYAREKQ